MRTPLYDVHVGLCARMAPFAGWDMPIQYSGIVAEHLATRTTCGMFDTCHMGEFELRGSSAVADLDRLLSARISTMVDGQCRYAYLLNEQGGVLDDLTCYRFSAEHYMLVVNAGTCPRDYAWIRSRCSTTTTCRDLSAETAKLDVQGPKAREVMERAFEAQMPALGYFRFAAVTLAGVSCILSRTGYTGEFGYEIYFPASRAVEFWSRLVGAGAVPAGLGARDTLRLEMGYPLYGHELNEERTPIGASRGMFVDLTKEFIGRTACVREKDFGSGQCLVGLRLESRRAARAGDAVRSGTEVIGQVTSGSFAPSLGVAVAMAYVNANMATVGNRLDIAIHGGSLPAVAVDLPFYRNGTARSSSKA